MHRADRQFCLITAATSVWLLAACTEAESTSTFNSPPPREQVLTFEYRVMGASPETILELTNRFNKGLINLERPSRWVRDLPTCVYSASFDVLPGQRDADMPPDYHTRVPRLNAFGNPGSPGFNFYMDAYQARSISGSCPSINHDIQGIELVSTPGHASAEWREGDTATLVVRPELGPNYLGPPLLLSTEFQGNRLPMEYIIDSIPGDAAHATGRFRFVAANAEGTHLVLVTGGEFTMNNAQGPR